MQLEKAKNKKNIQKETTRKEQKHIKKQLFLLFLFASFFWKNAKTRQKKDKNKATTQAKKTKCSLYFPLRSAFVLFVFAFFCVFSKVWFPGVVLVCFLLLFFKRVIYRIKLDPVDTTKYVSICQRNRQHTTASDSKGMQRNAKDRVFRERLKDVIFWNFNFWIREVGPRSLQNFARWCSLKIALPQTLLGSTAAPWLRKSTLLSWNWTSTTSTLGLLFWCCSRDSREVSLLST